MKRSEVYANRLKWAKALQRPENKKNIGALESIHNSNARSCLGHACHYFDHRRDSNGFHVTYDGSDTYITRPLTEKLGLISSLGGFDHTSKKVKWHDLIDFNDLTNLTPQDMGRIMENEWLQGGPDTPFLPLTDYAE